jgi:phage-related protein
VAFVGSAKKDYLAFPRSAQKVAGFELQLVQEGKHPTDFKPMPSIGPGVQEIRVWVEEGTFRVIYVARFADAVYVLHAFQKKTQATETSDLDLARSRYRALASQLRLADD